MDGESGGLNMFLPMASARI